MSDHSAESHRARAIRLAGGAFAGHDAQMIVHALLAIEDRLDSIAYCLAHPVDVRRHTADDVHRTAEDDH